MRVSALLVAATASAAAHATSLLARAPDQCASAAYTVLLRARADDPVQCASTCGSQAAQEHLDAATKCAVAGASSTDVEECLCTTPELLQGVLDCMQTTCPDNAVTFQQGCDIVTSGASASGSSTAPIKTLPPTSASTPTPTTVPGAGSALSVPVLALSSVLLAGVALL